MDRFHTTVLLREAVEFLSVRSGKKYIDATIGGAGHTDEILKRGGIVLGLDSDLDAIKFVNGKFKVQSSKFKVFKAVRGNFRDLRRIAKENGFEGVAGILFDLGVSGHQFDTAERGFSFSKEGSLDMRMDTSLSVSARDLVNGLTKQELEELFVKLGEERFARKIASSIVAARASMQIETTKELGDLIRRSVYRSDYDIHPATRVFQALRIAVNDELNVLRTALPQAVDLLESGGRLVVISFHSLEDRIVKRAFLGFEEAGRGKVVTKKPVASSDEEMEVNPRSRSAKMRVFEKGMRMGPSPSPLPQGEG